MLPVYPAREKPIEGVTSDMILELVTTADKKTVSREALTGELAGRDTDIVVTFGAGDIDRLVQPLEDLLRTKYA